MKKKLLAILMSLAMILTFMPAAAFAEEAEGDGSGTEPKAWLKWTEVEIPGNTPIIIAETVFPEEVGRSYSWKYLPSGEDPDAAWEELDEDSNTLRITDDSGYGEGQYVCCITANIDGEETTVETDPIYYTEPSIGIVDGELAIDQSVNLQIKKYWAHECFRFAPDEDGEYFFVPSSDSTDLPNIMGVIFDLNGVQLYCWDAQLGEPIAGNQLVKGQEVYVSFFYEPEDESSDDTYDITVSVVKESGGGDGEDEEDFGESFEFDGTQYYYSRNEFEDEEYVKEVVKGAEFTISPFDVYRIWYLDDNEDEVTVEDPAELFGDQVTYEWMRPNDETGEWERMTCVDASYTKQNVEEADVGYYECSVIYNGEVLLNLNAEVVILYSVEINGETYSYRKDPEWESHMLGEEVTLNNGVWLIDSNGEPVEPDGLFSKIEWYRLTEEDGEQKEILVSGTGYDISMDGSLHIDKVTEQDYGEYICRMYYDNENYIESSAGLMMGFSTERRTYVGLSELNGVGQPNIIYSGSINVTPGSKLTYQWYYRDLDTDDPSYTGDEEGALLPGENGTSIEPKYGKRYYHCNITASMKGYGEDIVGSNLNYESEIPNKYLDPSSLNFTDDTGGSITDSFVLNEEESEYYSFKPAANKVYKLTATCNSTITDPIEVEVSHFDSNGVRPEDDKYNCAIEPSETGTAVTVLTFESSSAADPVYFAASIWGNGSGSADISFEITQIGDVEVYHVVEFETDNNEIMPSQLVKNGEKLTPESEPGKEGYTFDGWYTDAGCTAAFDPDTAITADTTLYAKWTEDITDVEVALSAVSFEYTGEAIQPEVTVKAGDTVVDSEYYSVTYEDNIEPGTAKVTVTGKDALSFSKTVEFQIVLPDTTALSGEIDKAEALLGSLVVSEDGKYENGEPIPSTQLWVTQAVFDALKTQVQTAKAMLASGKYTASQISSLADNLNSAYSSAETTSGQHKADAAAREVQETPATAKAATLPLKTKQKVSAAANLELPAGVSISSVTSSNTKVLTVSGTTLKGKKKGKATVTCTLSNGTTVSYTVKVQAGKVKAKITGVPKTLTLHVGETYQITADKGYVTCKDKIKYTSNKKKVAKVSKKGLITAKKKGTAKITVKCGSKKKTVKVKVIP